jgi:oxaloacetate decarboxylase alpha subunit
MSDEELLLRLTMPAEQVDAMVHAPARPMVAAGGGAASPLVRLLREVAARPSISYLRLLQGEDEMVWRRGT